MFLIYYIQSIDFVKFNWLLFFYSYCFLFFFILFKEVRCLKQMFNININKSCYMIHLIIFLDPTYYSNLYTSNWICVTYNMDSQCYCPELSFLIIILWLIGDLRLNEGTNISFSLTNTGDSTAEFIITISDGDTTIDVQTGFLQAGQIYEAVVMVTPDSLKSV